MPMLRRLLLATGGVNLAISLTLLFGMQPILAIVGGNALQSAKGVMVIMAFVPLTGGINTVLGIQTMMAFNFSRAFSRMVAASGFFNLVAVVPLALRFGERGAAISYVMSETMLLLSMSLFLHRKGINLLTGTMRHA
jgi:PST family polysaccharide transporter